MEDITSFWAAIIGGCFTVIGGILGAWSTYYLARRLANEQFAHMVALAEDQTHRIAAANLRAAFAPALAQLDLGRKYKSTHEAPDVDGFLKSQLLVNAAAIEEFRPFVSTSDMAGYDQAWGEYYEVAQGGLFVQRYGGEQDPHSAIQKRIHAILTYAKT